MNTTIKITLHNGQEMNINVMAMNLNNPAKVGIRTPMVKFCLMVPQIKHMIYKTVEISFDQVRRLQMKC